MNFPEFLEIFSSSFVLRFPVKGKLLPNLSYSRSKKSFHLPWLALSRYFVIHVALKVILKD